MNDVTQKNLNEPPRVSQESLKRHSKKNLDPPPTVIHRKKHIKYQFPPLKRQTFPGLRPGPQTCFLGHFQKSLKSHSDRRPPPPNFEKVSDVIYLCTFRDISSILVRDFDMNFILCASRVYKSGIYTLPLTPLTCTFKHIVVGTKSTSGNRRCQPRRLLEGPDKQAVEINLGITEESDAC